MKFLDEQLKKLDTPYVDFYILHAMNNERMDAMQKLDYKRFYAEAIAHGKVRLPGFSFHDDAKAFLRICTTGSVGHVSGADEHPRR